MESQKKKIKLYIFIIVLIGCFVVFLIFTFKPYSYNRKYQVNKYEIEEIYNKETGYYTFLIQDDKTIYSFLINHKYTKKRELINNVLEYKGEDEKCLLPEGKNFHFYPLCKNDEGVYTYNLSNLKIDNYKYNKIANLDKSYEKIELNYLNDKSYLVFNYRGFYSINPKENKNINLFNNDIYTLNLIYQSKEYVIVPDYNETHYFSKIYLINVKNGSYEEIKLETPISFDSVFLGEYKNKVYLLDKKEEKEYQINLRTKKIEETDYLILENNKLVKKSFKDIVVNNLNFLPISYPEYKLQNNILYQVIEDNLVKISNLEVSKIIKVEDDTIYYLAKDSLMMYNNKVGEIKLLSSFEWNFNNDNIIYIF